MSERDDLTLHRAVWEGSLSLASILPETELEVRDPHGRTALMLAVMLGRADSAKILVDAGADVNTETEGWTVVQEATARGDRPCSSWSWITETGPATPPGWAASPPSYRSSRTLRTSTWR